MKILLIVHYKEIAWLTITNSILDKKKSDILIDLFFYLE